MPRGGARIGAGRPKGPGQKQPVPKIPPLVQPEVEIADLAGGPGVACGALPPSLAVASASPRGHETPLEYMLRVMNDPTADVSRRDRMAAALAPFLYGKVGETGKKGAQKEAAEKVSGRLAPGPPPKLVRVK